VRAQEPWGRLEEVAEGVWALVSDPFVDRTTLCNGGIVAGRSGVAVVEAFATPRGAAWMAAQARRLTGRGPDVVVVTHYHADHSRGLAGFADGGEGPALQMTRATAAAIRAGLDGMEPADAEAMALALDRVVPIEGDGDDAGAVDLGGRILRRVPRAGHTASDVTLEMDDPTVAFCGDLVWNHMFPNYVDARPSALSAAVAALPDPPGATWVPGHGPVADRAAAGRYRDVLDAVEAHAREAHREGRSAAEAAEDFALPEHSRDWALFSPSYFERALGAWLAELGEE
jgi:glyoxylase-like metal-dependent hydrolase (beta-lactamase superfamily II)